MGTRLDSAAARLKENDADQSRSSRRRIRRLASRGLLNRKRRPSRPESPSRTARRWIMLDRTSMSPPTWDAENARAFEGAEDETPAWKRRLHVSSPDTTLDARMFRTDRLTRGFPEALRRENGLLLSASPRWSRHHGLWPCACRSSMGARTTRDSSSRSAHEELGGGRHRDGRSELAQKTSGVFSPGKRRSTIRASSASVRVSRRAPDSGADRVIRCRRALGRAPEIVG